MKSTPLPLRSALLATTMIAGLALALPAGAQTAEPQPGGTLTEPAVTAACSDGRDNDGDGLVDTNDPQCSGPGDNNEAEVEQQTGADPGEEQVVEETGEDAVEGLVVTGSRIRRTEFTSASPVQVITAEQSTLEGLGSTTEMLQSASAAANARQLDNQFTGFVTAGGPGANQISLRGLGAQRTLVLLNGRRIPPGGTRGQVGAVDLNAIPATIIERTEILKDGASSIYGSDAVAGVVNLITKTKLDGVEIGIFGSLPFEEGGEAYRAQGSWGKTFNRGYINASAEYFEQKPLLHSQRDYLNCSQDYFFDENTGERVDITYTPGGTDYVCFNQASGVYTRASDTGRFVRDPTAVQTGSANPALAIDLNGYRRVNVGYANLVPANAATRAGYNAALFPTACPTTAGNADLTSPTCIAARVAYVRASQAAYPQNDPRSLEQTAISPVKRTSFFATAGFDLTPTTEIYGELLLNRRESEQVNYAQFFQNVNAGCDFGPGTPTAPCHPFNPFPFSARSTILRPSNGDQTVNFSRVVGGIRGEFPAAFPIIKGWDWDIYGTWGKSDAEYGYQFNYADRTAAVIGLTGTRTNPICNTNLIVVSDGGPDPTIRDGTQGCVPVNFFREDVVVPNSQGAGLTPEEYNFLFGYETGLTEYTQTLVEGSTSGDLFNLPAGPLGVALGFQVRKETLNDVPGFNARNNNLQGQSSAGVTTGEDTIKELFGELSIPVLRGMRMFESLDISASARRTNYESYGTNDTWKLGLNWRITDQFRIRASDGTSFRAPALYEIFLAPTSGFLSNTGGTGVDVCTNLALSQNPTLVANCTAALTAVGVPADQIPTFPGRGNATTLQGGGGPGILDPETSRAKSLGVIWTPTFIDLNVAVDYSDIRIEDQVGQLTARSIVNSCYASPQYPNNEFCQLFQRQTDPLQPNYQSIQFVNVAYVNIASQTYRGIDLTVLYRHEFSWADFRLDAQFSWSLEQESVGSPGAATRDFVGEVNSPDFVGNVNFRFDRGPWTLFYGIDLVGKGSDSEFFGGDIFISTARGPNPGSTPTPPSESLQRYYRKQHNEAHGYHAISLRHRWDDWSLQAGIRNLFNEEPPAYSAGGNRSLIGNVPFSSQYDIIGRRLFFNITKRW